MIISCEKCQSRFKLNKDRITRAVCRVRCSKCGNVFNVYKQIAEEENNISNALLQGHNCRVVCVCNQKGGVAKTSTTLNLGYSLTGMKKRVLLIDFDAQANLTVLLGYHNTPSFYDAVTGGDEDLNGFIRQTPYKNLFLLPANNRLVLLNKNYFGKKDFEYLLRNRLAPLRKEFDYIIIDTPPSIEFYTLNALTAADLAVIPGQCDYLSTHGIDQISRIIELVRKKNNPDLISRVLITLFDSKSSASEMIFAKLTEIYKGRLLKTIINYDEKIRESQIMSQPVLDYDRKSKSGSNYLFLAKEISEIGFK